MQPSTRLSFSLFISRRQTRSTDDIFYFFHNQQPTLDDPTTPSLKWVGLFSGWERGLLAAGLMPAAAYNPRILLQVGMIVKKVMREKRAQL